MNTRLKHFVRFVAIVATLTSTSAFATTPQLRGLYVNSFSTILGNQVKEDSLLHYAQDSSFNYLALYSLQSLNFASTPDMTKLAAFINKARTSFGMQYIGAVGENYSFFSSKIKSYNDSRTNSNEKFNVFNLEFEFWVPEEVNAGGVYCVNYLQQANCNCDTSGGFKYYIQALHQMDSLAGTMGVISETYVGWFNQGQGSQIQKNVDRILLHAYRVDASSVFGYSKTRLGYLASNNQSVSITPIFSAETSFMGPWLTTGHHGQIEAYNQYMTDFTADNSTWKQYINIQGYQWFAQSYMPKPAAGAVSTFSPVISYTGSTTFCVGGSITLTATAGDSYQWSNGANTQSITVTTSGSFTCSVTKSGTTKTTAATTVSVYNYPSVSVIVNSASGNIVPLNSATTAGSGSISSYQWKMNSSTISGATTTAYNAATTAGYSLMVSNNYGCVTTSEAVAVNVPTSSGCILTTPTGTSSGNATSSSITVSWNAVASSDSIVVRYCKDGTVAYNYIRMRNTGQTSTMISNLPSGVKYSWRVKTVCGTRSSGYSSKKYFTLVAPAARMAAPEMSKTDEKPAITEMTVYPNPATDNLNIKFSVDVETKAVIQLMDLTGRISMSEEVRAFEGENTFPMNIEELPNGIYIVALRYEEKVFFKKILVQ